MKRLGLKPLIHETATTQNCSFGRFCEVMEGCYLNEVEMDDYSYCAGHADIWCTLIGKFSNIAAMTRINPGNHSTERASLHHFMYRATQYWPGEEDDESFFDGRCDRWVHIGQDTWIGHGAIILPGRSVGYGAVVGAGAVVTKDMPSYSIVAGNPAAEVRPRFPENIAERLEALAWWDWTHDHIGAALHDFQSLSAEAFLERHESG